MATDYVKDPAEVLDYSWDWSTWLDPGETISTAVVVLTSGLTLGTVTHTSVRTTAFISGGDNGRIYQATNTITTSLSRTAVRTVTIRVTKR